MKSKIIILAVVAITLLSFTVITVKRTGETSNSTSATEKDLKGFALQDNDQF